MSATAIAEPRPCIGWDIGGAHLKLARVDAHGHLVQAAQYATPLWEGVESLRGIFARIGRDPESTGASHGLTMTGELVDRFADRERGVNGLLDMFEAEFPGGHAAVYSNQGRFLPLPEARRAWRSVASANWHATASVAARAEARGVLVDIGSTTTDLVPFDGQRPCHRGGTDQERLQCDELVYTGVVRTPVMALAQRAPFAGSWQNVAADFFATTADVYRVTGDLCEGDDVLAAADGAGKERRDSLRRLARMLGTDLTADPGMENELIAFARFVAATQLDLIGASLQRLLATRPALRGAPIVGAGSGAFIARRLARNLGVRYIDFPELIDRGNAAPAGAAVCATAVAVALLTRHAAP